MVISNESYTHYLLYLRYLTRHYTWTYTEKCFSQNQCLINHICQWWCSSKQNFKKCVFAPNQVLWLTCDVCVWGVGGGRSLSEKYISKEIRSRKRTNFLPGQELCIWDRNFSIRERKPSCLTIRLNISLNSLANKHVQYLTIFINSAKVLLQADRVVPPYPRFLSNAASVIRGLII